MGVDAVQLADVGAPPALAGKPVWQADESAQLSDAHGCGREGAPPRAAAACARDARVRGVARLGVTAPPARVGSPGSSSPTHVAAATPKTASGGHGSVGDNIYGELQELGESILRCARRAARRPAKRQPAAADAGSRRRGAPATPRACWTTFR